MPTLTWNERFELARRFSPRLILFPEDQSRARPGKQTELIGDYHPRGVELLLARGIISSGAFKPRQPATLDALAACAREDDELLLLGKPLPCSLLVGIHYPHHPHLGGHLVDRIPDNVADPVTVADNAQSHVD